MKKNNQRFNIALHFRPALRICKLCRVALRRTFLWPVSRRSTSVCASEIYDLKNIRLTVTRTATVQRIFFNDTLSFGRCCVYIGSSRGRGERASNWKLKTYRRWWPLAVKYCDKRCFRANGGSSHLLYIYTGRFSFYRTTLDVPVGRDRANGRRVVCDKRVTLHCLHYIFTNTHIIGVGTYHDARRIVLDKNVDNNRNDSDGGTSHNTICIYVNCYYITYY